MSHGLKRPIGGSGRQPEFRKELLDKYPGAGYRGGMGRDSRYVYTSLRSGWIAIHDRFNFVLASIHCPNGDAQEQFEDLCHELRKCGWKLEERFADFRFVSRSPDRWLVSIVPGDPWKPDYKGFRPHVYSKAALK